jgi:hypothetical protein
MTSTILLPPSVIGYIASFIRTNFESELLLNMYKAFESIHGEGYEDPLVDYKAEIQSYIVDLAVDGVFLDERKIAYTLSNREIMYVFDCYYCDPGVIMYGEETYEAIGDILIADTQHKRMIDNEFMDCSEYTESLALPYMGIQFGLSDDLNIKMYKYIRLLEEALRLKSRDLVSYMKEWLVLSPDMLMYIYIKHNNPVYAPTWYSLATDDMLLGLLKDAGVLPAVLGLAISGKSNPYISDYHNTVNANLAVVKKIVPRYIGALDEVVPYKDYLEGGNDAEFMSPLRYWRTMFTTELEDTTTEEAERYVILVGTEEFGVYLEAAAHV